MPAFLAPTYRELGRSWVAESAMDLVVGWVAESYGQYDRTARSDEEGVF